MKKRKLIASVFAMLFALSAGSAVAQVAPGFPNFVAFDRNAYDTVDLMNNNVALTVEGIQKGGAIPFSLGLSTNSYLYVDSTGTWHPSTYTPNYYEFNGAVNGVLAGQQSFAASTLSGTTRCSDNYETRYMNWVVSLADGTVHPLSPTLYIDSDTSGLPCKNSFTATTIDGSGFTVVVTNGHNWAADVYARDGTDYPGEFVSSISDANGNTISQSGNTFTDTVNIPELTQNLSGTEPSYSWTDVNGGSPTISQTTTNYVLRTTFQCTGITDLNTGTSKPLVTTITLADGRTIGLTYETTPGYSGDRTGRINTITLPEGGTVSYTYSGGTCTNVGIDPTYQTVPTLTRTLGNGDVTTYTLTHTLISGTNYKAVNVVVDPSGNETDYTFTGFTATGSASLPTTQALTEVQRYQGKGASKTLLSTDIFCYNTSFSSCSTSSSPTATVSLPITEEVVFHQPAGLSTWAATDTTYDTYGNVTNINTYDFGGTNAVAATAIVYGTWNGSSCVAITNTKVNNRPCTVTKSQGSNTLSATRYTYDTNGNLLSTSISPNGGSSYIGQSISNVINTNGTPSKTYDLANNETDYSYDTTKYTGCPTGGCNPIFLTQIKNAGTGNYMNYQYYAVGGVQKESTDRNGNSTVYGYATSGGTADPYWRLSSQTDPYSAVRYFSYPTSSSPTTGGSSFTFNSGNSIEAVTNTVDGYGRLMYKQVSQSPTATTYDTVSYTYSASLNAPYYTVTSSEPCSANSGSGCTGVHTFEYDPLGRPYTTSTTSNETITYTYPSQENDELIALSPAPTGENNKQVQTERDGLGRTSKVCHIGSTLSTGSGTACNQNTGSYNGTTDAYTYSSPSAGDSEVQVVRNSTQTHELDYDGLGRLIKKIIPEAASSTQWTYKYDSDSSCPSGYRGANGLLASVTDPDGNKSCYGYDSQNRLLGINANGTSCRHFYYDASTGYDGTIPSGISPSNYYGRIVEGTTDACAATPSTSTIITDEWFAYDDDGRMTASWELTPHSTQYYKSTASYFDNSEIEVLTLASPSVYALTYGLDGEGRWNTLNQGSTSIVTGPLTGMYDAAGRVLNVQLTGSTPDQDIYTYDPNTGRMKTFKFEVGSSNLTGTLTWNPNRTLGQLQIVDGFNSGGSETCYSNSSSALGYGYDDWGRLVEFDCGSGNWGQQFSYDQNDNLTKAVISGRSGSTWNPGYGSSNNRVSGATYDSNGNMTNDGGSDVYGWNEFSQMKWTAGSGTPTCGTSGKCVTYDAFGRMVETSNGTAWVELWYTEIPGSRISMTGTTEKFAYWPSPGRGVFIDGSSKTFLHQDWLGNDRIVSSIGNHTVTADRAYTPYGEQYNTFGSTNPIYGMFAEISCDYDSGILFDTPNRELAATQGRWVSPDPAGASWNAYAYTTNPHSFVDPTGLCTARDVRVGQTLCNAGGGGGGDPTDFVDSFWNLSDQLEANFYNEINSNYVAPGYGTGGLDSPGIGFSERDDSDVPRPTLLYPGETLENDDPSGDGLASVGDEFWIDPGTSANSGSTRGTSQCTAKILNAVNNHFGASLTSANVGTGAYAPFQWPQVSGGTVNIDIFPPQGQTGGISPGRYPVNWWTYVIGYGSTLHIPAGPGGLDSPSTLVFSSGGFTAHLDSAYPYNPIGLLIHGLKDVLGVGGHSPCP